MVRAGQMAATKYATCHVVNDITFTGGKDAPMRVPALQDDALDGQAPDVLIIGGGISGVSIARELTRQKLDILVVDKECDLALGASGRNDGEVHPGIDLGRGSVKHKYIRRGNAMYDQICKELDVPFRRVGQYVCFQHSWLRPAVWGYCMWRKYHDGIADTELISGRELLRREPNFNPKTRFAISNPDSGCVCPYGLTIAYAENAVQNGARIALNTAVLGMDVADGKITAVHTNRGTLHPAPMAPCLVSVRRLSLSGARVVRLALRAMLSSCREAHLARVLSDCPADFYCLYLAYSILFISEG